MSEFTPEREETCKGCSASVVLSEEEIALLQKLHFEQDQMAVVTEEEFERRMGQCHGCQGLQYGTTCRYCGCLVAIKAKLLSAACPFPYQPKW
ncbi:DUF6171 family protein [Paenibacillus hexagrammi]|uniref:DUF6171 family protein n=1 Tax=Paenibacillus hexagrammi TaxID=2908839 RepID=A0ABY3SQJ5_9BACL|nr:DUF6171 family protein [Paenibacillus sp. YPD9-1]UJF35825.1 DUF6171 family protein [Paenibacillus sp. YPD9-1]